MLKNLFFLSIFLSILSANELLTPLFPNGEPLKKYVVNNPNNIQESLISNSGEFIVTVEGDESKRLKIWSISNKKLIYIKKFNAGIKFLSLSKDDNYLVFCHNKSVISFDLKKKKIVKRINTAISITSLILSQDGKNVVLSSDNQLFLYNIKNKKKIYSININDSIQKIKISKQNKFIVVLTKKSDIKIYDFKTSKLINSLNLGLKIKDIDLSNDEKKIVILSENLITILDIQTEKTIRIKSDGNFNSIKFMNHDEYVITYGWGGIYIWSIKEEKSIYNYPYRATSCSVSNDNRYLVSSFEANSDNLFLFNLITSKFSNFNSLANPIKAIYSESSKQIFSIDSILYGIKIWDLEKNRLYTLLDKSFIKDIDISEDDTLLVASSESGYKIKVWNIKTKQLEISFSDKDVIWGEIQKVSMSKNKELIAYVIEDKYKSKKLLKILDLNSLKIINSISLNYNSMYNIYFADNNYVVLKSYRKGISVVNINSGKVVNKIKNTSISLYPRTKFYSIYDYKNHTDYLRNIITNKRENSIKSIKNNDYIIYTQHNKIELINQETYKVLKSIYMKSNMDWLIIDSKERKYYRHMDNNLLLSPISLKPISKRKQIDEKSIDIYFPNTKINLINNEYTPLTVHFENLSSQKLYDIEFRIDDNNYTVAYNKILFLDKNESGNVNLYIQYNNLKKQSFSKKVELEVLVNGYSKKEILKIDVKGEVAKEVEIIEINSTQSGFDITIKNLTNHSLDNVVISILYKDKRINYLNQLTIEANGTAIAKVYRGKYDDFFMFEQDNLDIEISTNMLTHYKFNKEINIRWDVWSIVIIVIILIFIFIVLFILWAIYQVFYLKIFKNYKDITDMSCTELKSFRKTLQRRKTFGKVLDETKTLKEDFFNAEDFFSFSSEKKMKIISHKINGKIKIVDNNFYEVNVSNDFEIDAKKILFYLPIKISISEIYNILQKRKNKVIIVIAQSEKEQKLFLEDKSLKELQNVVLLSSSDLRILLLLANEDYSVLAQIISLKINRTEISPYQTSNRINNKSRFFGRESIISNVYERELANYLIVGARQIGKSSLLSALYRKFEQRKDLTCIFISLGTDPIAFALAKNLPIDNGSSMEEIVSFIYQSNKKYLFFIDEFDEFVVNEKENNYKVLHTFRTLSSEGRAYFIVVGFWKLFYEATFNYQSPIKNFGEMIRLGKLESQACNLLITKPMDNLNLKYKNHQDIQKIIYETGQRANLISIVCNKIVHILPKEEFEINSSHVAKALRSNEVLEDFDGFHNLSGDDKYKSAIDKIIGYSTIHFDSFTFKQVLELFRKLNFEKVTIDDIKESLKRLELSYIIERDENNFYRYTIPLFIEKIRNDEVDLSDFVDEFRRDYS